MTLNVVWVKEVNGPSDGTDVEWWLITTLPIDTPEDVWRVVDYYTGRWPIEIYFRIFKTGCRVEDIGLETKDGLLKSLAFYKIVGWRVMYLTYLGRECPQLPCDCVFTEDEWKPVWKVVENKPIPERPPSLVEFLALLARLGGYNGQAGDRRPPGPQAIWVGLRRMRDLSWAWRVFGPEAER